MVLARTLNLQAFKPAVLNKLEFPTINVIINDYFITQNRQQLLAIVSRAVLRNLIYFIDLKPH